MNYLLKFKEYLKKDNVSANTIDNYIYYVQRYMKWYEESSVEKFNTLSKEDIDMYLKTFPKETGNRTINVNISGLKKFNTFLIYCGVQNEVVIDRGTITKSNDKIKSEKVLSETELETFRKLVCANDIPRNYAIITVLAYAGLKLTECIELKVNDIDFDLRVIKICGKNSRNVPMDSKVESALKLYFMERDFEDYETDYLFASSRDKKLDKSLLNKVLRKYRDYTTIPITTQTLRNFYCERLRNQGYSDGEISVLAGYKTKNKYISK